MSAVPSGLPVLEEGHFRTHNYDQYNNNISLAFWVVTIPKRKYLIDRILLKMRALARGYKTFLMLNSVESEILDAQKYENIKKFAFFLGLDKPKMLFFPLINC